MHLLGLRKAIPNLGALTVAGWAWRHRGTLVRAGELALQAPGLLAEGRRGALTTEARAILALDTELPTDMGVRISSIEDGTLVLRGDPGAPAVRAARRALEGMADVETEAAAGAIRVPASK